LCPDTYFEFIDNDLNLSLSRLFQLRRPQCFDLFRKFTCNLGKPHPFCRRHPIQSKPLDINAEQADQLCCHLKHLFSFNITVQVMAVSHVSPGHQNPVGPCFKCL